MSAPQITLTARLSPSVLDTRRGVVRLHPEVLDALGLRPWDAVRLTGARVSVALAAAAEPSGPPGTVLVDELTLANVGARENAELVVSAVDVTPARSVSVSGSRLASTGVAPETLRLALIGKVVIVGDTVSLLPQDIAPPAGADVIGARRKLAAAIPMAWTNELITITASEPRGAVAVQPSTVVSWRDGQRADEHPAQHANTVASAPPTTVDSPPQYRPADAEPR
ncbi:MAG: AAA family ATPase, partial [Sciscionella sp.]